MVTLAAVVTSLPPRPVQGVRSVVEQELLHWRSPRESGVPPRFTPVEIASRSLLAELAPESSPRPARRNDPVAALWRSLTNGRLCVVETFMAGGCCCAITEERTPASDVHALTDREIVLLHRTFQTETQKVLAAGFDLSVAAISQLLGGALQKLGITCRVGCTPLPIVLAALRYCGVVELPDAYVTTHEEHGRRYVALALPAFDVALLPGLSGAEREVAAHHAAGATYGQIATRRITSPRTVANQIASLSKKLEVHGRFDLIRYWADLQWGNAVRS
ncbi:MAG TPA: helix-turn-helix transcriptional regulator [Polyangiaceae bacterium]